jgi:signal transduction histidine kinase
VAARERLMRWLAGGAQLTVAAVLGFLVLIDVAVAYSRSGGPIDLLVPLSGAVTVVCVLLRSRQLVRAVTVAVATSLAVSVLFGSRGIYLSGADIAGLAVLTMTACRVRPARAAVVLLGPIGVALLANGLRATQPTLAVPCGLLFVGALMVGGYLRWLDWQRDQAAATARRDERLDLARELHDLVAHYVTGIVVQAQAGQIVASRRPEAAQDALASIERAGTDALEAMRRLVGALRSPGGEPVVEQPAGSAGLHELVRECNAAGLPARLRLHDVAPDDLPPAVAASVHRIVQESLTNVRRHGVDVTTVDVEVVRRGGRVEIVVRDDGRVTGRPPASGLGGGFGLVGMAERTSALGGTLDVGPLPEGGWQVRASLPLDGAAAAPLSPGDQPH